MSQPAPLPQASQYAVILPALNEQGRVGKVVAALRALGLLIIVVDDGSTDDTRAEAEGAGALVFRHDTPLGKGEALRSGIAEALRRGVNCVVTMDADGQHRAEDVRKFVSYHERTGIPVLIGNRMSRPEGMPLVRRTTNYIMSWMLNRYLHQYVPDSQNGFRLYAGSVLPLVMPRATGFAAESEILLNIDRLGFRIDSVPVPVIYGSERSKIKPVRDTIRFLKMWWRFRKTARTGPAKPNTMGRVHQQA
jgi:glycosyltransferase involved in cell wall biosynthesis